MSARDDIDDAVISARLAGMSWEEFADLTREVWADQCREEAKRVEERRDTMPGPYD